MEEPLHYYLNILNPCPHCGELHTAKYEGNDPQWGDSRMVGRSYYLQCSMCGYMTCEEDPENDWNEGDQPKIAIIVPQNVRMSAGKLASQAVHAALRTGVPIDYDRYTPTCVTLSIKNQNKMKAIVEKCKHYGVPFGLQTDLGYTEVVEGTVTALAVGPAPETLVDLITKRLRLLKS